MRLLAEQEDEEWDQMKEEFNSSADEEEIEDY